MATEPETFTVTGQHLQLLRHMYVDWQLCETGAPAIDPKRPYGNSDVAHDMHLILTGKRWTSEEPMPDELHEQYMRLHRETEKATQIALCVGEFAEGTYYRVERYNQRSWRRRESTYLERYDLVTHVGEQRDWSRYTFGPGLRTNGILEHIEKEMAEIRKEPLDLEEWVDIALLAMDGAWRTGASPQQVATQMANKLAKNKLRNWPDWRTTTEDRAIEHVREEQP